METIDQLTTMLAEGRLGRREFLRRAAALGLALPAAGAVAGAADAAGKPKKGGTLVFARNFEPVSLSPFGAADNGTIWTIMMIYDQLVEYQPGSLDPQPGLAKSWEISNAGRTYTFHLRDARFSNGQPVTAEDVRFSLVNFMNPKVNVLLPFLATSIASVSAPNPRTVVMHLKRPDGALLANLSVFPASIVPKSVVTKSGYKGLTQNPVGSGPFVLKEWMRGQRLNMTANPHHWRKGKPYLDGVEFQFITNDNTRILKLRSGEVDVVESIPFSQIKALNGGDTRVEVAPLA